MWYRVFVVGLLVTSVALGACEDEKDEILFGDPVAGGMGVAGTGAAAVGAAVVTGLISATAQGSNKPAGAVLGAFPSDPNADIPCDQGNVSFEGDGVTGFVATMNGCQSAGYTIQGTATVTNMTLVPCDEDGENTDVPSALHAVVTATVSADGDSISLNGLTFDFSNPTYDSGLGGTCALEEGDLLIAGGSISTSIEGETFSVNVPVGSLDVHFEDAEGVTTLTVDGNVIMDGLCADNYGVTIATVVPLQFGDGSTQPFQGEITANGEPVNVTEGFIPEICDGEAFQ
jgi:hypothetical protein